MSDDTDTDGIQSGDTPGTNAPDSDAPDTDNIVDINRWRDFNDAEPQQLDGAWPAHAVESTGELKSRMLVNIRGVLSYLFPGGVFQRGKFFVGDIHGNRGDSLVVEIEGRKAGLWHDFATGEGGDIIGLWAVATGRDARIDFPTVIADILAWLEGRTRTLQEDRAGKPRRKKPPVDELGPITVKWDYLDDDGRLIAIVYRYDPPGGKQFRPWDVLARKKKAPDPRPLYNRPDIKAASDVILVEGEKAAAALIGQGLCATTAMNGASAPVEKTDWSPLKARRVVVWPDHDEPGRHYALAAAQAVLAAGAASVSVLNPPADKPEKWDAADAVAEGITETGAAVIVAHHMRKPQGNRPITTVEQARDAVRGTSAIVDGVRLVYALWPAPRDHQRYVFKTLDEKPVRNAVFQGAVVKANGPADRTIRTYMRAPTGLPVDVTRRLRASRMAAAELSEVLVASIARAAESGHPFTHTGGSGVYRQRHRLAAVFHDVGRDRLEAMVQEQLNEQVLIKGMAAGSKEDKWLDIPSGPFARGVGEFVHGADESEG